MGLSYFIVDVETTGLRHGHHDIVEISVIRYADRLQLSEQVKAVNPYNASYDALQITGKTMKDLYYGIDQEEMIEKVNDFINLDGLTPAHRCFVGHNVSFDRKFLHHTWSSHNKILPADLWLDTLALSKRLAKARGLEKNAEGRQKFNLYATCDLFGVKKMGQAHTAKDDTRNTYMLFKYLLENDADILDNIKRIPHGKEDDDNEE